MVKTKRTPSMYSVPGLCQANIKDMLPPKPWGPGCKAAHTRMVLVFWEALGKPRTNVAAKSQDAVAKSLQPFVKVLIPLPMRTQ